ncbi:MAG: flagella basal body P-ring formation protein FlgA [Hyphomonadaceae bacterium]
MMRSAVTRFLAALAAAFALSAAAYADPPLTLRERIEVTGPAVTLGDVFENAGPAGSRAVALSPPPGQTQQFSARFLSAAAAASGLEWSPAAGVDTVPVTRLAVGGNAGAVRVTRTNAQQQDYAVRRGEMITLVYVAPGLQLTTRARALANGAVGDTVRAINLQSNRELDVLITGTSTATANAGAQTP